MTPQELLAKGIAENNMDLIKQANEILQRNVTKDFVDPLIKKSRGRPKGKVLKGKNKPAKKKKQKESGGNFLEKMYNIEEERFKQMINGGVGSIMNPKPIALDDASYFVEEHEEDLNPPRGLGKNKRKKVPRRPPVRMVEKNCPRCQKLVKVSSNEVQNYTFEFGNENSMLPTYNCGCVN